MKHSLWLPFLLAALLTVPVMANGWQGGRSEARRMRAEIRREWADAARETRRAFGRARHDMHLALRQQRRVIRDAYREAYRDARRAAREARRRWY